MTTIGKRADDLVQLSCNCHAAGTCACPDNSHDGKCQCCGSTAAHCDCGCICDLLAGMKAGEGAAP